MRSTFLSESFWDNLSLKSIEFLLSREQRSSSWLLDDLFLFLVLSPSLLCFRLFASLGDDLLEVPGDLRGLFESSEEALRLIGAFFEFSEDSLCLFASSEECWLFFKLSDDSLLLFVSLDKCIKIFL